MAMYSAANMSSHARKVSELAGLKKLSFAAVQKYCDKHVARDSVHCGPGTSFDRKTHMCVPSAAACLSGTRFADGRCVAEHADPPCGEMTIWADSLQKCVPDCHELGIGFWDEGARRCVQPHVELDHGGDEAQHG